MPTPKLDFRRYAFLQSMKALLSVFPGFHFRTLHLADFDPEEGKIQAVAPQGTQLRLFGDAREGDSHVSWVPDQGPESRLPEDETFHVAVLGHSFHRWSQREQEDLLRHLIERVTSMIVVRVPAQGAVGELSREIVAEFLSRLDESERLPFARLVEWTQYPPPVPQEIEALLEEGRGHLLHIPACDAVGGLVVGLLEAHFARLEDPERLLGLLYEFHNLALVESGPRLRPAYEDLYLIFPRRSAAPRAVTQMLSQQSARPTRLGKNDLSALQLALELERLDRERRRGQDEDEAAGEARVEAEAELKGAWQKNFQELRDWLGDRLEARSAKGSGITSEELQGVLGSPPSLRALPHPEAGEIREIDALKADLDAARSRVAQLEARLEESEAELREQTQRVKESTQSLEDFQRLIDSKPILRAYMQKAFGSVPETSGGTLEVGAAEAADPLVRKAQGE